MTRQSRLPINRQIGRICGLSAVILMSGAAARGGLDTDSPLLPPLDGQYLTPADVHATYDGPGLQIVLSDVHHFGFSNIVRTPQVGGTLETFDSIVTAHVGVDYGPDSFFDVFFDIQLTGPTSVFVGDNYSSGDLGTFSTEMVQLDLSGPGVLVRESPTLPSTGQTTITDIGGGQVHIDSFFDVFTELSLDNGRTWIPSTGPTHVNLAPLPEPGTLALTAIGAFGVILGAVRRRNRRAT